MNTLYININGENIQSTEDIIVVGRPEDAIVNKFFFELGKEILKGVVAPGVTNIKKKDIVTDFKAHDENSFNSIVEQWDTLKQKLLGENPSGLRAVKLPDEYISWLQNSSQPDYAEIAKSLYKRGSCVEVSLDKIYKNAIGIIINNIEPEECKECGQFVVNDDAVTDDSAITISIQERMPQIAFLPFEDFGKCPKCGKKPCECKPEEPVCPKCGKNPCECHVSEEMDLLLLAIDKEGSHDVFDVKRISVYDDSLTEIFNKNSCYGHLEYRFYHTKPEESLKLYIGESFGIEGTYNLIAFDGTTKDVNAEDCPWSKIKAYHTFNKEEFLMKHPEYDECEQPYHEVYSDNFIIECYKKDSDSADILTSEGTLLCSLPSKTFIERVFPSGLYAIQQFIDDDYLAFGISDKYGKILVPCQYKKHHRMQAEHCPFDEKSPGVIYCLEFSEEANNYSYYKNVFNGDFYSDVTPDFYVKKYYDKYERMFITLIDKESRRELYHLQSDGITERKNGWYEVYIEGLDEQRRFCEEKSHLALVSKKAIIEFTHGESLYDAYAEHAFENLQNIAEEYFISDSHIITMTENSAANGLGVFETIRIYSVLGKLIKEYEFRKLPLLIKSPYKYGKALMIIDLLKFLVKPA